MNLKVNKIELSEKDYQGAPSSMCQGCGHDAISASIRKAFYESSIGLSGLNHISFNFK